MYINYKANGKIETIEDMSKLTRIERKALIKEYRLVDANYYISQRATKDFYSTKTDKESTKWPIQTT